MNRRTRSLLLLSLVTALLPLSMWAANAYEVQARYTNALKPRLADGRVVQSCADPSVLRGRGKHARTWFMYCTSAAWTSSGSPSGTPVHRQLAMLRSTDLVHWRYVGSALSGKPAWAKRSAHLWAPDVVYSRTYGRYYMTFAVTDTSDPTSGEAGCAQDPAIAVASSASPTGPWRLSPTPLVPPRRLGPGCSFASTIDPDVLGESVRTTSVLYYGGFRGGIQAQPVTLGRYAMRPSGAARQITIGRRYEGANVVARGGFYYLFASSGSCCTGPLSGYSVFAGRSPSALGPFVDREGNALTAGRAGGTPVLGMNGSRWVGPGHNSVFRDFGGQWWTAYHAIDRDRPYFVTGTSTRRPAMLDPVDWVDGWPSVRSGRWVSSTTSAAPAAQPNGHSRYRPSPVTADLLGAAVDAATDEFSADTLDPRWSWVRPPADPASYGVEDGAFRFDTQPGSLASGGAGLLTQPAPAGNYVVQTAVRLDVPAEGCCQDRVQAGLAIYGSDDRFLRLIHVSAGETRITEFGKQVPPGPAGYPRYGSSSVGPPADLTWLRIVKRTIGDHTVFTPYTSQDGARWIRGSAWAYDELGGDARIGLLSMGGAGFTATFDHVRVWTLVN
jgi:arabinan endo-1,5-alpha-L-arabinosidase